MQNEKQLLKQIFQKHKPQLDYLEIPHEKLIICFSGIPCTGKTYIAKIIENKYKGVRISTNNIRKIIKELGQENPELLEEVYKEEVLDKYVLSLIEKYPFPNGLILLNKGIDRTYDKISSKAKQNGFKLFTLRINASRKVAEEGVVKKLGKPDQNFIRSIDRWVKEYEDFGKTGNFDFTINNDINKKLNADNLFKKLDEIIK